MAERERRRSKPSPPNPGPGRFAATIHPGLGRKDLAELDSVPMDRLPNARGRVAAILSTDEIIRLLDRGYEVRLSRHLRIQPLSQDLAVSDAEFRRSLEERFRDLRKQTSPSRPERKR
jgi:hypothetical protein